MAPKPIAVVTSDTHGEPRTWARHPGLWGDSYFAIDQITEYCSEHNLPLILAGDVFDKNHPDPRTVSYFVNCLSGLRWRGLGVHYIQGQHEYSRDVPWLSLVLGAWHVNRKWFFLPSGHDIPRIKFWGLDFTHAGDLPAALAEIPKDTDVLIAHQVWEEHMGKHTSPEGSLKDVPHVKLVITGDFHGHKVTNLTARDGRKLVVASPGSTCLQSIDEDPVKYFFVLHDDLSLTSVPLACRPLSRHVVHTQGQLDELVTKGLRPADPAPVELPPHIATPIVQVKYLDSLHEAEARIRAAAGDRCHLFLSPIHSSAEKEDVRLSDVVDSCGGLEKHLAKIKNEDPAKYATALRLWRSAELKEEVEAIVEEALRTSEAVESQGIWTATQGAES